MTSNGQSLFLVAIQILSWILDHFPGYFAAYLSKLRTYLDEIFWRCGAWPGDQSIRFCWRSGIPDHDPNPDGFRCYVWQTDST